MFPGLLVWNASISVHNFRIFCVQNFVFWPVSGVFRIPCVACLHCFRTLLYGSVQHSSGCVPTMLCVCSDMYWDLCTISSLLYVFTLGCMHPLLRFCLLQVYFRTLFLVSMPIAHCATLAVCLFYHISLTPFMPFLCSSISLPWFLVGMLPQSFKHASLTFTMS